MPFRQSPVLTLPIPSLRLTSPGPNAGMIRMGPTGYQRTSTR